MKKGLQKFISTFLALLLIGVQAIAYSNSATEINSEQEIDAVVAFDENEIYNAFDEVEELVATIETSENISYSDLEAYNSDLITNVSSSAALAMNTNTASSSPIFSPFVWGCLFNVAGMLVVGITTDFDSYSLRKSAWGCLFNTLLFGGGFWGIAGAR